MTRRLEVYSMGKEERQFLKTVVKQERKEHRPALKEDDFFELFTADQILRYLEFDLELTEVESGMVGQGGDAGVDTFYVIANRVLIREDTDLSVFQTQQLDLRVVVIQSKREKSFGEDALLKFGVFARKCLKYKVDLSEADKLYHKDLMDAVHRFHALYNPAKRPTLSIQFFYASEGDSVHTNVKVKRIDFLAELRSMYSSANCGMEFVGAQQLWEWFQKPRSGPLTLEFEKLIPWKQPGKSYVGLVALGEFYRFISKDGAPRESLFESNVRDHQRGATVNREIGNTLKASGREDFWWLNNGITIIADRAPADGEVVTAT